VAPARPADYISKERIAFLEARDKQDALLDREYIDQPALF
jgi:hypothetical protein